MGALDLSLISKHLIHIIIAAKPAAAFGGLPCSGWLILAHYMPEHVPIPAVGHWHPCTPVNCGSDYLQLAHRHTGLAIWSSINTWHALVLMTFGCAQDFMYVN